MSKLLTNQIANYNDNGPVEAKEGLNFPTGKPLQVAGSPGAAGEFLKSTGTGLVWDNVPIPAAQVNADWTATSGVAQILNKPTLAAVATSGDYNDLSNRPTIPAAQVQSDWNATSGLARILNKPTLFSGAYSDLTGRPTIPATLIDLQDIDLPNPIVDNTYIKWSATTNRWVAGTGAAGLLDVVEDTSPQLGGNLDVQSYSISGTTGTIELRGQTSKLRFHYDEATDLPSAADWHGMFAHVHDTGKAYYAHSGQWIALAKESEIQQDTNTTYSQQAVGATGGVNLRLTDSNGVQDDITITAGANIVIDNIGSNGFRIASTASGGGGATVTTSDSAPSSPVDGDLWWKSNEGRLKVYYADGDTNQWVDASPPLAATGISATNSRVITQETAGVGEEAIQMWGGNALRWRMTQAGHILPNANNAYDIGSAEYKIRDLYVDNNTIYMGDEATIKAEGPAIVVKDLKTGDLHLDNTHRGGNDVDGTTGSWTFQEGSEDLFLLNNVTGKRYKFNLTEVN
jgi:hypothetical protein